MNEAHALKLLGGDGHVFCVVWWDPDHAVHFLSFVEKDELVTLYRHAHALTYVSLFGPANLPPLEAMALGCPVVAADVPGA